MRVRLVHFDAAAGDSYSQAADSLSTYRLERLKHKYDFNHYARRFDHCVDSDKHFSFSDDNFAPECEKLKRNQSLTEWLPPWNPTQKYSQNIRRAMSPTKMSPTNRFYFSDQRHILADLTAGPVLAD